MSLLQKFPPQTPRFLGGIQRGCGLRCPSALPARVDNFLQRPLRKQHLQPLISVDWSEKAAGHDKLSRATFDGTLELPVLIEILPTRVKDLLQSHPRLEQLVEVVLDLGRPVVARFANTDEQLSATVLTRQELEEVTLKVTEFGGDNRAGIDRCLHRISCIRNRDGRIVGLTCRVGRAVAGSANLVADVVLSGRSLLLLGRPGVGKTTAIRDISRMLAVVAQKRVVIVDTSNEIAGDGNVPHPAIDPARRMQVPVPEQQHKVMIEAVENHMPEVIVIDEIGSEAEAIAAATIAQRGVQLVATAHGDRIENILNNPALQGLLGGVESVTLGDETAKKRGTQKSIRERSGPPTFDCCIEMVDRQNWRLWEDVAMACDSLLAGREVHPVLRYRDADGNAFIRSDNVDADSLSFSQSRPADLYDSLSSAGSESDSESGPENSTPLQRLQRAAAGSVKQIVKRRTPAKPGQPQVELPETHPMQVYVHGIAEDVINAALRKSNLSHKIQLRDSLQGCDAAIGLRGKVKAGGWLRTAAKGFSVPIYCIKTNSVEHLTKAMHTILGYEPSAGGLFGGPTRSEQLELQQADLAATFAEAAKDPLPRIGATGAAINLEASLGSLGGSTSGSSSEAMGPSVGGLSGSQGPASSASSVTASAEGLFDPPKRDGLLKRPVWTPQPAQPRDKTPPVRPQTSEKADWSSWGLADEEEIEYEAIRTYADAQGEIDPADLFSAWKPRGHDDAVPEVVSAVEQIVIPRQQPIELLPRPQWVLSMQMAVAEDYDVRCEIVGSDRRTRLRISPPEAS